MSKLSSKNSNNNYAEVTFSGGINVSAPATNINDNELQTCRNMYYSNLEQYLTTRMGIKKIDIPSTEYPIDKLYEYRKDESNIFLCSVSNGVLYYLKTESVSGSDIYSWDKIMDLTTSTIIPTFTTFNNTLIIADRGATLKTWDGTTSGTLSGSPSYPTLVETAGGRLVCNSEGTGELDAVYFSAPFQMEDWDTNYSAKGVRVGYGDGKRVTGLGVMVNDVIVFKESGLTYRISLSDFSYHQIFANNSCNNPSSIEPVGNDLVFGSETGINSIETVKEYGDLKTNKLGMKVSSMLNGKTIRESTWSVFYGVLFLLIEGTNDILVFHPHLGSYTIFDFGIRVTSIVNGKYFTYLSDNNGNLFRLTNMSKDELNIGVYSEITTRVVSKTFSFPNQILLKKSRIFMEQLDYTTGSFSVVDRTGEEVTELYSWTPNYAGYLHDADEELFGADIDLYGDSLSYVDCSNQYEDQAFSFIFETTQGRIKIKSITINYANVSIL